MNDNGSVTVSGDAVIIQDILGLTLVEDPLNEHPRTKTEAYHYTDRNTYYIWKEDEKEFCMFRPFHDILDALYVVKNIIEAKKDQNFKASFLSLGSIEEDPYRACFVVPPHVLMQVCMINHELNKRQKGSSQ